MDKGSRPCAPPPPLRRFGHGKTIHKSFNLKMQPFKSAQLLSVAMETVPLYSLPIPYLQLILFALQREEEVNSELLIQEVFIMLYLRFQANLERSHLNRGFMTVQTAVGSQ